MTKIYYTSDLHFHHRYVAKLRGFTKIDTADDTASPMERVVGDPEEHDAVILDNWNHTVRKDDIAFILGDFAMNWKNVEPKIRAMNGRKILITGNHDPMFPGFRDAHKHQARYIGDGMFEAIQAYARRKVGKHEFLMSHFPYYGDHTETERYEEYRLKDTGMWLLHGHTHSPDRLQPHVQRIYWDPEYETGYRLLGLQLHVGVDAWGLSPVPEEEVLQQMAEVNARLILEYGLDKIPA